mgnify:CR=1 FL=1
MRIILVLMLSAILSGCGFLQSIDFNGRGLAARSAIEVATLKFIDGDQDRAQRINEITSEILAVADRGKEEAINEALNRIENKLRNEIVWSNLDDAEALLINRVIDVARNEIEERAREGTVDKSVKVAAKTVLEWIRDISNTRGAIDDVKTVGRDAPVGLRREYSQELAS